MIKFLNFYKEIIRNRKEYWQIKSYPYLAHLIFILPIILVCLYYSLYISDYSYARELKIHYTFITLAMRVITAYTNIILYFAYFYIFVRAYRAKDYQSSVFVLSFAFWQITIGFILVMILKNSLGFSRPLLLGELAKPFAFKYVYQSMPSGHTTEIFILALPLALYYKDKKIIFALLCLCATLVGLSRLWLQAHYPADVLGGLVLASLASFLILKTKK